MKRRHIYLITNQLQQISSSMGWLITSWSFRFRYCSSQVHRIVTNRCKGFENVTIYTCKCIALIFFFFVVTKGIALLKYCVWTVSFQFSVISCCLNFRLVFHIDVIFPCMNIFSWNENFWSPVVWRPSVCLSVCKVFTFSPSSPLQNHWANLNLTWHKASLGKGNISFNK